MKAFVRLPTPQLLISNNRVFDADAIVFMVASTRYLVLFFCVWEQRCHVVVAGACSFGACESAQELVSYVLLRSRNFLPRPCVVKYSRSLALPSIFRFRLTFSATKSKIMFVYVVVVTMASNTATPPVALNKDNIPDDSVCSVMGLASD